MTEIKGDGKNGKRLWIRTPKGDWAAVPYGAGENDSIRSLNIWNGTNWMTPASGWQVFTKYTGSDAWVARSLQVRAPGRNWNENGTHLFNPTFMFREYNSRFTPEPADYIRLFHVKDKNNPNMRIVTMNMAIPTKVPNTTTNYRMFSETPHTGPPPSSYDVLYFWPFAGGIRESDSSTGSTSGTMYGFTGGALGFGIGEFTAQVNDNHFTERPDDVNMTKVALLVDLKAIRKRLENDYAQRSLFFTGQYAPIQQMTLRRIVFSVVVQGSLYVRQDDIAPATFDGAATVYVEKAAPTTQGMDSRDDENGPFGWNTTETYRIRSPIDASPTGDAVVSYPLQGGTVRQLTSNPPHSYDRQVSVNEYKNVVIENPGEDNIKISCQITGGSQAGGSIYSTYSTMRALIGTLGITYAVPGHDYPSPHETDFIEY